MLSTIKNWTLERLGLYKYLDSEEYVEFARSRGCEIGHGTKFYGEKKLDIALAPMITIGKNCKLTDGVRLVAHTGDLHVLKAKYDDEAPEMTRVGPIDIGDNVFIGERTIVVPDVTIGNNVVIGAGSVVTNDIPDESVAVGNPCEVIMDLEDYCEKQVEREVDMMQTYVRRFTDKNVPFNKDGVEEFVDRRTEYDSLEDFSAASSD